MKTIQIDREVLCTLYDGCQESLNEMFTEFLGSYDELRKNLYSAFESGNLNSLKRVLHFHGPSFTYLGMPVVADMFKDLEKKCAQADNHFIVSADFAALMKAVEEGYNQAIKEMDYYKKAV